MKIKALKTGSLNEHDRLSIATLLIKAGYTVRIGKEKSSSGSNKYEHYVEACESVDSEKRNITGDKI